MSNLSVPHFHNEEAAYAYVEARLWPHGPVCPRCGVLDRISKMGGKSTRIGTYKCYHCRKPFTVKVGTIFEDSHIPMRVWLQAIYLMSGSKKGFSANQLHRTLGLTLKSSWYLAHRIREAMRDGVLAPFGGDGGDVEIDETFLLKDPDAKPTSTGNRGGGGYHKMKVLSLVDRSSGRVRSFVVDSLQASEITPILSANIAYETRILTDQATMYVGHGRRFADHQSVNHAKGEYVRLGDPTVTTNTVEGYFSIFKRGMRGVYQHCSKRHLHRYVSEFDFRYSNRLALGVNDTMRADRVLAGVVGRRLTYRATGRQA